MAIPTTVPQAAASANSWSKPGISPFESYFQGLTEYVSPGNGLLGVEQTDLSLDGRGVSLNVTRVFATPYAFRGSSPYLYDNYTLTNLGYGWSLDFPWMGTNYLHLSDGQAYPYSWNGAVFQYNGQANFELINNGGTSGYTLYLASGTEYQFNSAKELTSITDHTGNNTISLSYGSNNYISQITDVTGRVTTFSYNSNNTLKSIAEGGRTWSYSYTGNDLSSVTDPLNRVTRYQYGTGINSWLISAVLYPTGGKTTYSYSSSPVGTEITTHYVSSRNIYSSATSLSQSESISYKLYDGSMTGSNATFSDGSGNKRSYQNYTFYSGYKPYMREYDQNSTKQVSTITEYDFDAQGRINDTKVMSSLTYKLVGYWPLDEGSGSATADVSGNGNTGTLLNSPTWQSGTSCKYVDCLGFAGLGSQSVSVPSTSSIGFPTTTTSFSISLWVNIPSSPSTVEALVSKSGLCTSCGDTGYGIGLQSGGRLFAYLLNGGSGVGSVAGGVGISTNVWHNVVFVDKAGALTLYLDGSLYAYASGSGIPASISNSNPLTFGSDGSHGLYLTGSLDDVRVYGRALTYTEVTELNTNPVAPPMISASSTSQYDNWGNLIYSDNNLGQQAYYSYANTDSENVLLPSLSTGLSSYWSLDEGKSTTAADTSGNANTLTLQNSPTWLNWSSCLSGNCLSFSSASSQYASAVSSSSLSPEAGSKGQITVAARVYPTTVSSNQYVVAKSSSSGGNYEYGLGYSSTGEYFIVWSLAGSTVCYAQGSTALSTGAWYFLVGEYSAVTGTCAMYLNAVSVGTGTASGTAGAGTGEVDIGRRPDGIGYLSARVDEVRIYSRELTSAEITTLYTGNGLPLSFYANAVVSPYIHDALVGEANWQNGPSTIAQVSYYEYDAHANLLVLAQSHNSAWLYTDYTYDKYGNLIVMIDSLSRSTHYHYSSTYSSAYLTLTSSMVGTQNITQSYTYDPNTGYMLSSTDGNGHTTSYAYDALGRVLTLTYPSIGGSSGVETYSYNDTQNYVKMTDPNGNLIKEFYDGLARPNSIQKYNGSSLYSTQSFTYNWENGIASNTTAAGHTYSYAYNQDGLVTQVTNPDSSTIQTSYNNVANTKTVTDENGHQITYAYNSVGQLTAVDQYYTSTKYFATTYTYDLSGNLLATTDPNSQVTTYKYDDLNRLVKTTYPDLTYETKSYDAVGNLVGVVTPAGAVINYTYDALNRMTRITYPDSSTVTYTYDGDGNVLSIINAGATDYYTYDARDMVTNQTEYISSTKYSVLYGYDKVGNVKSIVYPNTYNLTITYDALNRIKKLGSLASFTYTLDNLINTINYGNGEIATYTYDNRDRPMQIKVTNGGVKRMDLNYTYNGASNVKTINTESYGYDSLNRLTSSSGPWGTIAYGYDGAGNMLNHTIGVVTTKYIYGSFNRLQSIGKVNFTYDGNGDTQTIKNGSTTWTYTYNYESQLTNVQNGGTTVGQFYYDGNGGLIKSVESNTQVFAYDGLDRIYAKNTGTSSLSDYFYADGLLVASINGTSTSYYHEDALGSIRLESSSAVTTLFSANYKPYGPLYGASSSIAFQYTGKPTDEATGLYYSIARFYDPATGRFMTEDSYPGTMVDPLSLNRYVYAMDNPESNIDPSGHFVWGIGGNLPPPATTAPASSGSSPSSSAASSSSSSSISTKTGSSVTSTQSTQTTKGTASSTTSNPPQSSCANVMITGQCSGVAQSTASTTSSPTISSALACAPSNDNCSPYVTPTPQNSYIPSQIEAGAVTVLMLGVTIPGIFLSVYLGPFAAITVSGFVSGEDESFQYDVLAGPKATPSGAFKAYGVGEIKGWLAVLGAL